MTRKHIWLTLTNMASKGPAGHFKDEAEDHYDDEDDDNNNKAFINTNREVGCLPYARFLCTQKVGQGFLSQIKGQVFLHILIREGLKKKEESVTTFHHGLPPPTVT